MLVPRPSLVRYPTEWCHADLRIAAAQALSEYVVGNLGGCLAVAAVPYLTVFHRVAVGQPRITRHAALGLHPVLCENHSP